LQDDFLLEPDFDDPFLEFDAEAEETTVSIWQILGALLIVGTAAGLVITANNYNARIESDVSLSYNRLSSWGRWLGLPFRPTQTPHERATEIAEKVPEGEQPVWKLTQQYVLKKFSRSHMGDESFDSRQEWQRLRPYLLRHAVKTQLHHWWERWRQYNRDKD
jgi:hypothetical protein